MKLIEIKWIIFLLRHEIDLSEINCHIGCLQKQMYKITHFSKLKTNIMETFCISCIKVLFGKCSAKNCKIKMFQLFCFATYSEFHRFELFQL